MLTAIKEIKRIKNHKLTVTIPDDFGYDKVEVLIFPCLETEDNTTEKGKVLQQFQDLQKEVEKFDIDISPTVNIVNLTEDMNNAVL